MKMVLAIWQDAAEADAGPWVERATLPPIEPVIFHQVGYLYALDAEHVVLTACVGKEQMGVRSQIPTGMVKRLVELTEGKPVPIPRRRKKG